MKKKEMSFILINLSSTSLHFSKEYLFAIHCTLKKSDKFLIFISGIPLSHFYLIFLHLSAYWSVSSEIPSFVCAVYVLCWKLQM